MSRLWFYPVTVLPMLQSFPYSRPIPVPDSMSFSVMSMSANIYPGLLSRPDSCRRYKGCQYRGVGILKCHPPLLYITADLLSWTSPGGTSGPENEMDVTQATRRAKKLNCRDFVKSQMLLEILETPNNTWKGHLSGF